MRQIAHGLLHLRQVFGTLTHVRQIGALPLQARQILNPSPLASGRPARRRRRTALWGDGF
jgi:hypothetical protein